MLNKDQQLNFFSWETEFSCTVVIDDCVYPNSYNFKISFIPKTDNIQTQNIGFERVKYLAHRLCDNAIIFSPNDKTNLYWFKMPVNKILLPGNPYDQLLAICLFRKINSIAGKFFHFGELTVDSRLGDNIKYTVDDESIENKHLDVEKWVDSEINPWWNRDDTATFDQRIDAKTIWTGGTSWEELGYVQTNDNKRSFNPTVIDGGREK
jgi:hypothetical protein